MDGVDSASLGVVEDEAGSRISYVRCCSCKDANEARCYKHRLAPSYGSIDDAHADIPLCSALGLVTNTRNTGQALTYPFLLNPHSDHVGYGCFYEVPQYRPFLTSIF